MICLQNKFYVYFYILQDYIYIVSKKIYRIIVSATSIYKRESLSNLRDVYWAVQNSHSTTASGQFVQLIWIADTIFIVYSTRLRSVTTYSEVWQFNTLISKASFCFEQYFNTILNIIYFLYFDILYLGLGRYSTTYTVLWYGIKKSNKCEQY